MSETNLTSDGKNNKWYIVKTIVDNDCNIFVVDNIKHITCVY